MKGPRIYLPFLLFRCWWESVLPECRWCCESNGSSTTTQKRGRPFRKAMFHQYVLSNYKHLKSFLIHQWTLDLCEGGLITFEKVTGHFLRTAKQEPIALTNTAPGVTLECVEKCKAAGADCPAFLVDHSAMRCVKLDRNTQGRGEELTRRDGQNYFEKICLRG